MQCGQLIQYVKRGGSIVATHETSLYDEWGKRRENFGLSELFGARFEGAIDLRMQNSYIHLEHPHPLLNGFAGTTRIINGVSRVHTASISGKPAPLTLIPSYPDLPMEDVYPRVAHTNIPAVHLNEFGAGRVVYFPWDIDRTFWEVLAGDHLTLLRNAVLWATNEELPVKVSGPGVLDLAIWRQKDSLTVHLVNLTNPMMMKGPVRETIPLSSQLVRMKLPNGSKAKTVHLLVASKSADYNVTGGQLEVRVPSIGMHEVVAVDLS
jgi:hypothetical protein